MGRPKDTLGSPVSEENMTKPWSLAASLLPAASGGSALQGGSYNQAERGSLSPGHSPEVTACCSHGGSGPHIVPREKDCAMRGPASKG